MASVSNTYNSYVLNGAYTSLYKTSNPKVSNTQDDVFISLQGNNKEQTNLSDNEILEKIRNQTHTYQEAWRKSLNVNDMVCYTNESALYSDDTDINFINNIDTQLKQNMNKKITLQEAEEAQEFLNKQMDSIMLELYKKNPKLMEDTMKKEYDFYTNGGFSGDYKPSEEIANLQTDRKLSSILLAYQERVEQDNIDKDFSNFIKGFKENFKEEEIDEETLAYFKKNIDFYLRAKQDASGYHFFSYVTDMLSPSQQEQISNAISKVITFYSQTQTLEVDGAKLSWENQQANNKALDKNLMYGLHNYYGFGLDNLKIEYKADLNKPTNELLTSLSSNLNSTQNFFDMLEQREKLEKENQELQNKRGLNLVNNPYIETKSDGILKEVLKSKDKEIKA
ncbi:hypothetical protein B6S12_01135 [Helicobacter valdiviensis]|uniref:Uncharacterized protein n=2 Tax=Helicobacter valdiviensis TaxID=1458358 RepID=A0A2W6MXZ8_9HELI|nr:hypothetical protein [Helicobacter valdiviensis]PZT48929.1 hypothetical protein B6S12_01135 [Helicobacter valdiviensis]